MLPKRFGAAADLHAFDGGDRADDHGHERRLDQPGKDGAEIDGNAQPVDECGRCDVGIEPCRRDAAAKCGEIGDDRQARQCDHQRDQPRKHQNADRIKPDDLQRVDLLAHFHRADLCRDSAARTASDHDRSHQHAELAQDQHADKVDDEDIGTEIAELIGALLGDDRPDDGRHQHDHRDGADAHAVHLVEDRRRIDRMAAAKLHLRAAYGGSQYVHRGQEIVAHLIDAPANRLERANDDIRRPNGAGIRFASNRVTDGAEQDRGNLALPLHRDFHTLLFEGADQAVDHPGPGGIHLLDMRKVERQRLKTAAFLDLAHLGVDERHGACRPGPGESAAEDAAVLADHNARLVVGLLGGRAACVAFADRQHGVLFSLTGHLFILTEPTCRFADKLVVAQPEQKNMARVISVESERFPIAGTFTISRGSKTEAEVVTVTIREDGKSGRGECVPYKRYGETIEGVRDAIEAMREQIAGGISRAALLDAMPAGAARNAVDCALWDLEAKITGRPVASSICTAPPRALETAYTLSLGEPKPWQPRAAPMPCARCSRSRSAATTIWPASARSGRRHQRAASSWTPTRAGATTTSLQTWPLPPSTASR
ncbi:hypothetical protein BQ8794_90114 [Mesorhizobium prunaredense]|uniref:Mandelate racemase/muconate lactonizing enzyme N-terminal domain-containing protein n=1 Tax=Mesorhizobium prunaredense TaxID=1631249 RepID=A0A1R3VJ61_9HYPH|nr:hypothetical protein BQ8794_90114 [Mesorhizobium prunaredense]